LLGRLVFLAKVAHFIDVVTNPVERDTQRIEHFRRSAVEQCAYAKEYVLSIYAIVVPSPGLLLGASQKFARILTESFVHSSTMAHQSTYARSNPNYRGFRWRRDCQLIRMPPDLKWCRSIKAAAAAQIMKDLT
jgi:hypothetical protein